MYKSTFCGELDEILQSVPRTDKLNLLRGLNARVGSNHEAWGRVIGRHGIGKENENGVRFLNLSAAHDLTVTNTVYQLPNKHKTTYMHPKSKHFHQIDYIITRNSDMEDYRNSSLPWSRLLNGQSYDLL